MSETEFGDRRFRCEGSAEALYPRFALCWFCTIPALFAAVAFVILIAVSASTAAPEESSEDWLQYEPLLMIPVTIFFILALLPLWAVYKKREYEYLTECLSYEGLSFRLNITYWGFLWLYVGNALILIFTLTLGRAFTQLRLFRFVCANLEVSGVIDFEAIRQSARERPGSGEGLADAFDVASI